MKNLKDSTQNDGDVLAKLIPAAPKNCMSSKSLRQVLCALVADKG
jgi:hypothetical protein